MSKQGPLEGRINTLISPCGTVHRLNVRRNSLHHKGNEGISQNIHVYI